MTIPYIVKAYNYNVVNSGASTAPFLQVLHDHFASASTLWELDTQSVIQDASKAFTIKPKSGLQFQINFRRFNSDSSRVNVTIDPESSITNAESTVGGADGALPDTASAKAFDNTNAFRWFQTSQVGGAMWLIELADALFIMNKLGSLRSVYGCHAGRIMTPVRENDPAKGMEGFGIIGGNIGMSPAGGSQPIYGSTTAGYRKLKVSNDPAFLASDIYLISSGTQRPTALTIGGRRQHIAIEATTNSSTLADRRALGVMKYIHPWPYETASGALISDTISDQVFLYNSLSSTQSFFGLLVPWEKGVSIF